MRLPIHTRFQDATLLQFKKFYRANESQFSEKKKKSSDPQGQPINYLVTKEGYVVYRDLRSDGSWGTVRVATPAEVHKNASILQKSQALCEALNEDGSASRSIPRWVTHTANKSVPQMPSPTAPPTTLPRSQQQPTSLHLGSPVHSSSSPTTPPLQHSPASTQPVPFSSQTSLQPNEPDFTQEELAAAEYFEFSEDGYYTPEAMECFVKEYTALVKSHCITGSSAELEHTHALVQGALVACGNGISWPRKDPQDHTSQLDFDKLHIDFAPFHPDSSEITPEIVKSRFMHARRVLKLHEKYMHSETPTPERAHKVRIREELSAMTQYIQKRFRRPHIHDEKISVKDFMHGLCPQMPEDRIEKLLNGSAMQDCFTLPQDVTRDVCILSRALVKFSKREAARNVIDLTDRGKEIDKDQWERVSPRISDKHKRHEYPHYRPKYSERQLSNTGLTEKRSGTSVFDRLHDRSDLPYDYDDIEACRAHYRSKIPPVRDKPRNTED